MVPTQDAASLAGKTLDGRYELLEQIGHGGVGEVYRAKLTKLDRLVAVKVLHEALVANADFVDRFQREAKAMSRMHHPHCVAVLDFGVFHSRPYLVLEYLPGHTLTRLLRDGPFAPARAVNIALQLLDALAYFHGQSVIHRDLKSENLMLVRSGGTRDFVKVLDFGMAKIVDQDSAESALSQRGLVPGTLSAMAPEQIQQLRPDNRIDIYATGILLYEMIIGNRPFRGDDQAEVVRMQLEALPPRPRVILGESALSAELEQVILKALEKNRADRFESAEKMAEALHHTPEGQTHAPRPTPGTPEPPSTITVLDSLLASGSRLPAGAAATPAPQTPSPAPVTPPPSDVANRSQLTPAGTGRGRWLVIGLVVVGGLVALGWVKRASLETWLAGAPPPVAAPAAPPVPETPAAPPPAPPAPEAPAAAEPSATGEAVAATPSPPGTVPWIAHRDLAVVYAGRDDANETFRAVKAALDEDAAAASADDALLDAAVSVLTPNRVPFVLEAFGSNQRLVAVLAQATATGKTRLQRHAALQALERRQAADQADLVAMRILDIQQATTCAEIRTAFVKLGSDKDDPRVGQFTEELKARPATDRQVRCLRTALKGARASRK